MATTSNFKAASATAERYMVDTVRILRYEDLDHATVDPDNLQIVQAYNTLYEGKALISPMGDPSDVVLGGGHRQILYYSVILPPVDLEFQPDDVLTVTVAGNDAQMQDRRFIVEGEIPASLVVVKRLRCRLDTEAD